VFSIESDVFAFGKLLLAMILRKIPQAAHGLPADRQYRRIIEHCCNADPAQRMTAEAAASELAAQPIAGERAAEFSEYVRQFAAGPQLQRK
jgi:hypothetical protein